MGSSARLFFSGGPPNLEPALRRRLTLLEQRWSRFIDSSEVSTVNSRAGEAVAVSDDTWLLFKNALTASRLTRGWFDPTLLHHLEAAGYDRSFVDLGGGPLDNLVITIDRSTREPAVAIHDWEATCRLITMDPATQSVSVPAGVGFDPGGLGKGLAADLLLADALRAGATAAMIDLGGDIAVGGQPPEAGWPVALEDPFDPTSSLATARLPWGAVATSSRAKRRWHHEGVGRHHLIDPGTGEPSESEIASATVIAGSCWHAEAYAKAAVLAGAETGLDLLRAAGVEGLLVDASGEWHQTARMAEFVSP